MLSKYEIEIANKIPLRQRRHDQTHTRKDERPEIDKLRE